MLPLLVAAEAVVWRTDEWQSSGPQTTEVEALVPFGISGAEATPILSPWLHAATSGSFIFAVQVNPNLVNDSNVRHAGSLGRSHGLSKQIWRHCDVIFLTPYGRPY